MYSSYEDAVRAFERGVAAAEDSLADVDLSELLSAAGDPLELLAMAARVVS